MYVEQAPQIDDTIAVEEQQINRCAAGGREAHDQRVVVTPGKVAPTGAGVDGRAAQRRRSRCLGTPPYHICGCCIPGRPKPDYPGW